MVLGISRIKSLPTAAGLCAAAAAADGFNNWNGP